MPVTRSLPIASAGDGERRLWPSRNSACTATKHQFCSVAQGMAAGRGLQLLSSERAE